jgi:putative flippase GtrA
VQLIRQVYRRWQELVHELAKFGIVGIVCYAIDFGLYNVCHVWLFELGPITSKVISTVVAATCAYFGNRHWSFRHRARSGVRREYTLFIVLNTIGLVIALACLGFGYYVLDQRSALASNIWGNLIGTGLGTVFRFWAYKKYVFLHPEDPKVLNGTIQVVTERLPKPEPEQATRGSAA